MIRLHSAMARGSLPTLNTFLRGEIEQRDLGPRDMIDAQSFLWVQGSAEYEE